MTGVREQPAISPALTEQCPQALTQQFAAVPGDRPRLIELRNGLALVWETGPDHRTRRAMTSPPSGNNACDAGRDLWGAEHTAAAQAEVEHPTRTGLYSHSPGIRTRWHHGTIGVPDECGTIFPDLRPAAGGDLHHRLFRDDRIQPSPGRPLAPGEETVYSSHVQRVERIVRAYEVMDRSLGVILSGDKGMGKSIMLRMLAEQARAQLKLPTILVQHSTPGLVSFLDNLGEVVVVFDEFEKVFASKGEDEAQAQFLSLFDGLSVTKRLYVLSVNHLDQVNEFMLDRPGRFHYHMRFAYPQPETVATYLRDQVPGIVAAHVDEVVEFSRKYDLNFDHLRAIAFELRRENRSPR